MFDQNWSSFDQQGIEPRECQQTVSPRLAICLKRGVKERKIKTKNLFTEDLEVERESNVEVPAKPRL